VKGTEDIIGEKKSNGAGLEEGYGSIGRLREQEWGNKQNERIQMK